MRIAPPKTTVFALAYNHSQWLTETLDSIRRQSFQDFELFVADDASADNSADLIRDWNARHQRADRLFLHERNIGLCATLNELLVHATGEYVQIISCDDHLLPDALSHRVRVLDSSGPETAAVYSDALVMDDNGCEQEHTFLKRFLRNRPAPTGDLYDRLLMGNFIPAATVLMKRGVIEELGGYDESLDFEDWDLWQRLSRHYDFAYSSHPAVRYRIHAGNLHRTMKHQSRQFYRILAKHRDSFRARLRILLTIIRNRDDFAVGSEDVRDFLSWADDYRDTRWFHRWFFGAGPITQAAVGQVVHKTEGFSRAFPAPSREFRSRRAA